MPASINVGLTGNVETINIGIVHPIFHDVGHHFWSAHWHWTKAAERHLLTKHSWCHDLVLVALQSVDDGVDSIVGVADSLDIERLIGWEFAKILSTRVSTMDLYHGDACCDKPKHGDFLCQPTHDMKKYGTIGAADSNLPR